LVKRKRNKRNKGTREREREREREIGQEGFFCFNVFFYRSFRGIYFKDEMYIWNESNREGQDFKRAFLFVREEKNSTARENRIETRERHQIF
jgi:hypothetical protein